MPRSAGDSGAPAGSSPPPRRRRWSTIEREVRAARGPLIAGVDEVGRGPLAGPVVACAVVMPPEARAIAGVDDSKRLTCAARVRLAAKIRERALAVAVGAASVREIDRVNVYHATVLAMRRALARLSVRPDYVLVDGKPIRSLAVEHTAVVGGDARCYSIACASIVAKVTRDRLMERLAARYPEYRWEHNVGYATADHLRGLAARGVTPHHRRSFCRVSQLSLPFETLDAGAPAEALVELLGDVAAADAEWPGAPQAAARGDEGPAAEAPGPDEPLLDDSIPNETPPAPGGDG